MVVQHNMAAENSGRMQKIISGKLSGSSEKLSSGYRINRGADNAAGLSISEKMRFQIRGLDKGSVNIDEGIGYCQVADGALNEMHDMLQRMNELCIQAANGVLSDTDRACIDYEIQHLKAEIDKTCRTTKFNEEYIFRCEDTLPVLTHDVYKLTFSGRPKDLFIYNESYDATTTYAGVAFRGRRLTWDEIDPAMYDKDRQVFREGTYTINGDDGTGLRLVCKKGAKLPEVSRQFVTTADAKGVYVNNDLVSWNQVKISGNQYSFEYHGMTVSFTKESGDTFDDMIEKMSGTLWESTYEAPVEAYSVDAAFSYGTTYYFNSNTRIASYLARGYMPKYILHAEDINRGGTIPVHDENGNFLRNDPFDGVWLEGTREDGTPSGRVVYDTTSTGERKFCAMSWEEFGFNSGISDWGNMSTDIWSGADSYKDDPRDPYPADSATADSLGTSYFPNYSPYKRFEFYVYNNATNQREHVSFYFSVINEVSKEQVIETLNHNDKSNITNPYGSGIMIYYPGISPHNYGSMSLQAGHKNIIGSSNTSSSPLISLSDEYHLGRDYENGQATYQFQPPTQMIYNNGAFSISYNYTGNRGAFTKTFTMGSAMVDSLINSKVRELTDAAVTGRALSAIDINLVLASTGNPLRLNYRYDLSDFGKQSTSMKEDQNGRYIRIGNGSYQLYDPNSFSQQQALNEGRAKRYNAELTGNGGVTMEDYLRNTVFPDIAQATSVGLNTSNYPTGGLTGQELQQTAMVTRWQTPFQHKPRDPDPPPVYEPEYLKIQCSSNTIDYVSIQKQRLSVYRLGLTNVGTLSELQATGCIDIVGNALAKVSSVRSLFGAYQNRLESAYDINRNTHENTQGAESVIRDTDMAEELVKHTNNSILRQSADVMLAQANQANRGVLTLLN